jgi:hypothetical protein
VVDKFASFIMGRTNFPSFPDEKGVIRMEENSERRSAKRSDVVDDSSLMGDMAFSGETGEQPP